MLRKLWNSIFLEVVRPPVFTRQTVQTVKGRVFYAVCDLGIMDF
jgi:hypothetical protein